MSRLSYQIPNFTYPNTRPAEIFDKVVAQAKAAEAAGFDRVMVMDHFYQLPMLGAPDEPMFECYAMLSALAQHTKKVRLSALVTGNTYRNPALLAKTITTLDHVSHGRATLGIGAGWFEFEHNAYGFEFNTFGERFRKLEEALSIIAPMLKGERPTVNGKFYTAIDAINSPAPVSKVPIMIGGQGEKKTLRLVAKYADESNLTGEVADIPRKLAALAQHCEDLGRDRAEISVTKMLSVAVAPTKEQADADLKAFATVKGWNDDIVAMLGRMVISGDPDTVGAKLAEAMRQGIDGLALNMPANGHNPDRIGLLGEVALKVINASGRN
ncbi:MAG TPA: LLM class F420-dependent oxidoreductase [Pseudomonadales bacterium]|nr:LLM class F420-dependent oxidoreductase [Pseudomonadales bacterium]